jgi:hypothetical protein
MLTTGKNMPPGKSLEEHITAAEKAVYELNYGLRADDEELVRWRTRRLGLRGAGLALCRRAAHVNAQPSARLPPPPAHLCKLAELLVAHAPVRQGVVTLIDGSTTQQSRYRFDKGHPRVLDSRSAYRGLYHLQLLHLLSEFPWVGASRRVPHCRPLYCALL